MLLKFFRRKNRFIQIQVGMIFCTQETGPDKDGKTRHEEVVFLDKESGIFELKVSDLSSLLSADDKMYMRVETDDMTIHNGDIVRAYIIHEDYDYKINEDLFVDFKFKINKDGKSGRQIPVHYSLPKEYDGVKKPSVKKTFSVELFTIIS